MPKARKVVCPYCSSDVQDAGDGTVLGRRVTLYECSGCGSILEPEQLVDALPFGLEKEEQK